MKRTAAVDLLGIAFAVVLAGAVSFVSATTALTAQEL